MKENENLGPEPRAANPRGLSPGGEAAERTEPAQGASGSAGGHEAAPRIGLVVIGAVSVVAGVLAIGVPFIASLTAAILAGAVLTAAGIIIFLSAFRREGWHMAAAFALSIVAVVAGVLMLAEPIAGILALTSLVIAYLAASGILRLYYGFRNLGEGGGWMVATGVLAVVIALLLWFGYPFNAVWVPGLLLGVDLILWGALLLAFGIMARPLGGSGRAA